MKIISHEPRNKIANLTYVDMESIMWLKERTHY